MKGMRENREAWADAFRNRTTDTESFQKEFIRKMLASFSRLPAHVRAKKYDYAWVCAMNFDESRNDNFPILKTAAQVFRAFVHFADSPLAIAAFQPLFDDMETLLARMPEVNVGEFRDAVDRLLQ